MYVYKNGPTISREKCGLVVFKKVKYNYIGKNHYIDRTLVKSA